MKAVELDTTAVSDFSGSESPWTCHHCRASNHYQASHLIKPCTVKAECCNCGVDSLIGMGRGR